MTKYDQAIADFDAYNQNGPTSLTWEGKSYSTEYFYAIKLSEWVHRLAPEADEALLLAARCQHIGRWEISRSTYPEGRVGYLKWRSDLSKFHAQKAGEILLEVGYDADIIKRVQDINLKKGLKSNQDVQIMEDALCLVFLEYQFEALIDKMSLVKMVDIVQKTWNKMSEHGRQFALTLTYSAKEFEILQLALKL
jgi:hypothetical protein